MLFVGTTQGEVHVYNIKTNTKLDVLCPKIGTPIRSKVTAIASNEMDDVLIGHSSGLLSIWKFPPPVQVGLYHEHSFVPSPIEKIVFVGTRFVTRDSYGIKIWDLQSGTVLHEHRAKVSCMVADNTHLYCGIDASILKINVTTGLVEKTVPTRAVVSHLLVNSSWIISIESRLIYDPTQKGNVRLYDKKEGTCFTVLASRFPAVSVFLYNSWYIVSGHVDGTIYIWDSLGRIVRHIPCETIRQLLDILVVETGIITMYRRQLCYLCWEETSWKQKYLEYENQVGQLQIDSSETSSDAKECKDEKYSSPVKKYRKLFSFWDCK